MDGSNLLIVYNLQHFFLPIGILLDFCRNKEYTCDYDDSILGFRIWFINDSCTKLLHSQIFSLFLQSYPKSHAPMEKVAFFPAEKFQYGIASVWSIFIHHFLTHHHLLLQDGTL